MDKDKHLAVSSIGGRKRLGNKIHISEDDGIRLLEQILNKEEQDELQK